MPQNKMYTYNIKVRHHRDLPPKYLELIRDMLFKFIGDIPITQITITQTHGNRKKNHDYKTK